MTSDADPLPFRIFGPLPPRRPVLLSVPHAGRAYSAALLAAARVPLAVLQRLEDRRADLLIAQAVAAGFTAIVADAPRALIDLNRAEEDCDPLAITGAVAGLKPTARARGGLGLVPHRLAPEGLLWRMGPDAAELARRIAAIHRPWHHRIEALLADMRAAHGQAVLLDIHSMPPPPDGPDIAVGDRYGRTAGAELADALVAVAEGSGLAANRNHPYAGAFGIERHASADRAVQAVQIEVSRARYLGADGGIDPAGVARTAALIARMAEAADLLIARPPIMESPAQIAAE